MSYIGAPPSQRLSVRLGSAAADATFHHGVPEHLDAPLRGWARTFLYPALEQRVALQLRIPLHRSELREALDAAYGRSGGHLVDQLLFGEQLLDAVDLALQLDDGLDWEIRHNGPEPAHWELPPVIPSDYDFSGVPLRWTDSSPRAQLIERLDQLLVDAGSVFEVEWSRRLG